MPCMCVGVFATEDVRVRVRVRVPDSKRYVLRVWIETPTEQGVLFVAG